MIFEIENYEYVNLGMFRGYDFYVLRDVAGNFYIEPYHLYHFDIYALNLPDDCFVNIDTVSPRLWLTMSGFRYAVKQHPEATVLLDWILPRLLEHETSYINLALTLVTIIHRGLHTLFKGAKG